MKRFFLLIFTLFCALVFYQIILSKNGIIQGYQNKQEIKRALLYQSLLEKEKSELLKYIDYLENNPHALKSEAEKMGFSNNEEKFIKIIHDINDIENTEKTDFNADPIEKILQKYEDQSFEDKIIKIKNFAKIFYFFFFGFFIFLILFGIKKKRNHG